MSSFVVRGCGTDELNGLYLPYEGAPDYLYESDGARTTTRRVMAC